MAIIRTLKPNVTREGATSQLSPGGAVGFFLQTCFGPVRSVADFYIPFRVFQVDILNSGRRDHRVLALDAVNGSLDLYAFEQLPQASIIVCVETRNHAEALLDDAAASVLMTDKVRRMVFRSGFFRLRGLQISAEPVPGDLYIPYWIGFRGHGARAHISVIDALRRRFEGAKVKQLLQSWLTTM